MKKKVLIIVANYYQKISDSLYLSAVSETNNYAKISKVEVPGVFEIPVTISKNINKYDGFIALGCVIKGKTPHFDYLSKSTIEAIMNLSIQHKKPVGNGILTCLNIKQAKQRQKKGAEAAKAVKSILSQ